MAVTSHARGSSHRRVEKDWTKPLKQNIPQKQTRCGREHGGGHVVKWGGAASCVSWTSRRGDVYELVFKKLLGQE